MISFNNVTFIYPYDEFAVLKGATFTLTEGVNTILVDTQSGKSTIAKLLCRQIQPVGDIFIGETPLNSITHSNLGILYLSDKPAFFNGRSLLYNTAYPLKVRKVNRQSRVESSMRILQELGLAGYVKTKIRKLDSETRKTAALARGLTVPRKIVLFDDFFNDGASQRQIDNTLGLFPAEIKIILTSDANLARGNTVVLDGGVTVYQGDAQGAKQIADSLSWIYRLE